MYTAVGGRKESDQRGGAEGVLDDGHALRDRTALRHGGRQPEGEGSGGWINENHRHFLLFFNDWENGSI